jgi:hypothetical protein
MHKGLMAQGSEQQGLKALAEEVVRQANAKRDFVAYTKGLRFDERAHFWMTPPDEEEQEFGINDYAHGQIAGFTDIPRKYYNLMRDQKPELLAQNVNTWFREKNEARTVRLLDGRLRAFLSSAYRRRDNYELAQMAIPVIQDLGLEVMSAEITERRLYLKAVDKRIEQDIPKGKYMGDKSHTIFDTLSPALCLSNSEIGQGALSVEVGTLTKGCTNLAWFSNRSMRKFHLGSKMDLTEDVYALFSDETKSVTDQALWLQVRDTIRNAFDQKLFKTLADEIKGTAEHKIIGDVPQVVELVGERYGMTQSTRQDVLKHLIEGGSLSQYGLANAVTRAAEDQESYDHASDYEQAGGNILTLNAKEWEELNTTKPGKAKKELVN